MEALYLYQLPDSTQYHKTKDTLRKNRENQSRIGYMETYKMELVKH